MKIPRENLENFQGTSLPAVTVVELSDPTAAGESIEVLKQDLIQLETLPMRARQIYIHLEDSLLLYQSTNVKLRVSTTGNERLLGFIVFGPQAGGTVNGLPIGSYRMLAAEPGSHAKFVVEAGYESVAILLPPAVFMAHLTGRQREDTFRALCGIEMFHANESTARGLFDWGKRLAVTAAQHPEMFNDRKELLAAVQTELLEMLLAAIDTTTTRQYPCGHRQLRTRNRIVKLAEEYALAHISNRLYVTDLCIAVGVSERTLQYAFHEVIGMSPVAYLTRLRLHRVRKALRIGNQGLTTVSDQALRWGFWRFSDFSRAYKDCFGELPSETLRRKPAETRFRRS